MNIVTFPIKSGSLSFESMIAKLKTSTPAMRMSLMNGARMVLESRGRRPLSEDIYNEVFAGFRRHEGNLELALCDMVDELTVNA